MHKHMAIYMYCMYVEVLVVGICWDSDSGDSWALFGNIYMYVYADIHVYSIHNVGA